MTAVELSLMEVYWRFAKFPWFLFDYLMDGFGFFNHLICLFWSPCSPFDYRPAAYATMIFLSTNSIISVTNSSDLFDTNLPLPDSIFVYLHNHFTVYHFSGYSLQLLPVSLGRSRPLTFDLL